jgi:S1-C subfamily serine protease
MIQTTAPISPGSSGGGLFDAQGSLVGITTMVRRDSQNLNFAIAADSFRR